MERAAPIGFIARFAPVVALATLAACSSYEPMTPTFAPTPQVQRYPPPPPRRPDYLPPAEARPAPEALPAPGQTARLAPPHAGIYRVREGDTVYGIARRYSVDMGALVRLNRMAPPYRINAGERLLIPRAPSATGTTLARAEPDPAARSDVGMSSLSMPPTRPLPPLPRLAPQASLQAVPPLDVEPPPRTGDGFLWPVKGRVLAPFGAQQDGLRNDGINIAAAEGTPVRAAENGVVVYAGNELPGFGNLLILRHAGGWMTAYGHNATLTVRAGETVRRGQVVATVGHTGGVVRPQLHFEIRRKGGAVDPARYLAKAGA